MDYSKLEQLNHLRQQGAISEEEFQKEKDRLLNEPASSMNFSENISKSTLGIDVNIFLAIMNFVMLVPQFGWIISILIWLIARNRDVAIDTQGKNIVNFVVSYFLYAIVVGILIFISIGGVALSGFFTMFSNFNPLSIGTMLGAGAGFFVLIIAAILVAVVIWLFPIIAGIIGLGGRTFRYPLSISFLK